MTSNNAFAAQMCILVVEVKNESNIPSYLPAVGSLKGRNTYMCSDVAGPSSSGSSDLFELSDMSNETVNLLYPHHLHYWPPSWI